MTANAARPAIDGCTVVFLARGVRLREDAVRNQTVLLAPERVIALDEIAVAIIKEIDGHRNLDRIADDLLLQRSHRRALPLVRRGMDDCELPCDRIELALRRSHRRTRPQLSDQ